VTTTIDPPNRTGPGAGPGAGPGHGIVWFSDRVHAVLDGLAETPAWSMTVAEQKVALVGLARAEARIGELRLRVLASADANDIGKDTAAPSTALWVAESTRQVRSAAYADLRFARELDEKYDATRAALAGGSVNGDQARVIVHAVSDLPDTVTAKDRVRGERYLLAEAAHHDAKTLKILGRRLFDVLDPDAADAYEGKKLEDEERRAQRKLWLSMGDNGDGTHTGRFRIPNLHAEMLKKMLQALTSPRRVGPAGRTNPDGTRIPGPEIMGAGFCELLERYPKNKLPHAGGVSATIVVTIEFEKLLAGIGAAHLDTGGRISASEARRLACAAGIIPAVLGGPSQVLDLGRKRRFHTGAQRIALGLRDGGCTAEGCDRPPSWCHVHHDETSWADGGGTSVDKGRLLCPWHHGKAHHPGYDMTRLASGKVRFNRRT
jgi:Domain of unknown function (DUF222)